MKRTISLSLGVVVLIAGLLLLGACSRHMPQKDTASQSTDHSLEETLPTAKPPIEQEFVPELEPEHTNQPEDSTQTDSPVEPTTAPETGSEPDPSDLLHNAGETEPITKESIFWIFKQAMTEFAPNVQLDVFGMEWQYGAENDLRNLYYSVLRDHPELKYTYDLEISVSADTAFCKFLYMPYKIGAYAEGAPIGSHTIGSLHDAVVMAQSMIDGTEHLSIAITDPSLAVEDIQRALTQAGYGWIRFDLNRDGTEIIAQPTWGKTLEECVSGINKSFQLSSEIIENITTPDMTKPEKASAIYDYIVSNVVYDFRYYTDRTNMPFESTLAIGALKDGLAICGGYAQAFEMLLTIAGIENYTVSGIFKNEYHMWNYVVLDGVGYYCDPTSDRGGMRNYFMLSADDLAAQGSYTWDHEFLIRISQSVQ